MFFIMVTLDVLKLDKSKEYNDEHPKNIDFIVVTLDVSKLDKSISIIFSQFQNIVSVDVRDLFHMSVIYY